MRRYKFRCTFFAVDGHPRVREHEYVDDDWITMSFAPAAQPLVMHIADIKGTRMQRQRVIGWLVQHQYDRTGLTPTRSRVIPGVFNTKTHQIEPVNTTTGLALGSAYPTGEAPESALIDAHPQILASHRRNAATRIGLTQPRGGPPRSLPQPPPPIHAHRPPRPSPQDIDPPDEVTEATIRRLTVGQRSLHKEFVRAR
jgi:hypothetical protein